MIIPFKIPKIIIIVIIYKIKLIIKIQIYKKLIIIKI